MTETTTPHKFSSFMVMWFGQVLSVIGSNLTGFALSVWVYQNTGSVTKFSLVVLFTVLPGILITPLAGTIIDKWDRRRLIILSNLWAAFSTLGVAALFFFGRQHLWHVCLLASAFSMSSAVISLAFTASISLLVPKRNLGRASGMMQFGEAAAQIVAPLLGGFLVLTIKIYGVLVIDFITYAIAITTLLVVKMPRPAAHLQEREAGYSWLREAASGWTYIVQRPGLFGLLLFLAVTNFTATMSNLLITPLILSFANAAVYGTLISVMGVGLVTGSLVMTIWGGPRRRIYGVFSYGFLLGMTQLLEGARPHALLIGAGLFIGGFIAPVANGCIIPILQSKTLPEIHGRVFAAVRLISWCAIPVAYLLAGPLTDKVFGPLLNENGPLAGSIGQVIGVGPGRGIGLLLIVLGIGSILMTLRAYFHPRLSNLEVEIPDVLADKIVAGA
jgi:DHA3 family macrolide efflux protein-like MFS transporter